MFIIVILAIGYFTVTALLPLLITKDLEDEDIIKS